MAWPLTSVLLTTLNWVLESPFWLALSLKIRLAWVVDGNVNEAIPERGVTVSWVVTPLDRATE